MKFDIKKYVKKFQSITKIIEKLKLLIINFRYKFYETNNEYIFYYNDKQNETL